MVANIQFTPNFSLYELLESQEARRSGIVEQFEPPQQVIDNLRALCVNVLQPLRDSVKAGIHVNSGYRCSKVNTKIKGAKSSQHLTGHATDIVCYSIGNKALLKKIVELGLPFDQVINEFGYAWVHISYDPAKNRRSVLEAYKGANNVTAYRTFTV